MRRDAHVEQHSPASPPGLACVDGGGNGISAACDDDLTGRVVVCRCDRPIYPSAALLDHTVVDAQDGGHRTLSCGYGALHQLAPLVYQCNGTRELQRSRRDQRRVLAEAVSCDDLGFRPVTQAPYIQ